MGRFKIKATYIIEIILSYIKDNNIFYKIIQYSKSEQKRLNINKNFYKEKFLSKCLDFNLYLLLNYLPNDILQDLNINKNDFSYIALFHFEKLFNECSFNKYLKNDFLDISLYSPYFEIFSKSEYFKYFSIRIDDSDIQENNFSKCCNSEFDKLNKIKSNYTSLSFYCNSKNYINFQGKNNIDFHKIKALKTVFENPNNLLSFFTNLFTFTDILNDLIYLNLNLIGLEEEINSELFEFINNFKSLEYLSLSNFHFPYFELKLNKLKYLKLENCSNIIFKENIFQNLEYLYLNYFSTIYESYSLLKVPNVETCEFFSDKTEDINNIEYELIFDFSSFHKLKNYKGQAKYFILFNNTLLEKVYINCLDATQNELEQMINKIISIKTIKEIELDIIKEGITFIQQFKGENDSIIKAKLNIIESINFSNYLTDIQNKFPNLTEFIINERDFKPKENEKENGQYPTVSINEGKDCKVNNIVLDLSNNQSNTNIRCCPYENLESINISSKKPKAIIKYSFPLFDKSNTINFISLVSFHFESDEKSIGAYDYIDYEYNHHDILDFNILKSLIQNVDYMPNLMDFYFSFGFPNLKKKRKLFMKAVQKVLSLKYIKYIYFSIYRIGEIPCFYSKNELVDLFPGINPNIFLKINISKF